MTFYYYVFSTRMMSQTLKLMILLNPWKTMMISLSKLSDIVNVASHKMFADVETTDVVVVGGVEVEADI